MQCQPTTFAEYSLKGALKLILSPSKRISRSLKTIITVECSCVGALYRINVQLRVFVFMSAHNFKFLIAVESEKKINILPSR